MLYSRLRGILLKKESFITATTGVVFFGVGFLAGYIYEANSKSSPQQVRDATGTPAPLDESSSTAGAGAGSPTSPRGATPPGLPEGHPPVETAILVKAFEEEAALNPRDPGPRLRLANLYYDQKEYDKAIAWYRQGLELDPRNVSARTDLGTAYYYLGRPQDALKEYRKSLETDPRHAPTLFNMIVINLDGTHDLLAARQALDKLQTLNPNYPGLESMKQRLAEAGLPAKGARRTQ